MSDRDVKRVLILFIVMGFVLLGTVSVGTSYALLEGSTKDDDTQVIEAGSVSLKLTEYFESKDAKLSVMSDNEGFLSDVVYDFKLKNTGAASSLYTLSLINDAPSDASLKVLDNKYIKAQLEVNGSLANPVNLKDVNNVLISDQKIGAKELISFKLRLWFDERYKDEFANNLDAKTYFKINVDAKQDLGENTNN